MASKIRADCMTVEQTAEWVLTLGRCYNWDEASVYADNFAQNDIWGHLLPKLTLETLQSDLSIVNSEHRLKIMMAIKYLFPSMAFTDAKMRDIETIGSPMAPSWANVMDISLCNGPSEPMECD